MTSNKYSQLGHFNWRESNIHVICGGFGQTKHGEYKVHNKTFTFVWLLT